MLYLVVLQLPLVQLSSDRLHSFLLRHRPVRSGLEASSPAAVPAPMPLGSLAWWTRTICLIVIYRWRKSALEPYGNASPRSSC